MKKTIYLFITVVLLAGIFSSCKDEALEPTLAQSKAVEGSLNTQEDVLGILYGAYNRMTGSGYYGRDFIIWGEVRSDNCYSNGNSGRFVTDAKMDYTDNFGGHWSEAYTVIASANIVIALDPAELEGDLAVIQHYQGQAYAIRALAHYDLLIYYGQMNTGGTLGIPYIEEYKGDELYPARGTVAENKAKIMADIATAISMMNPAQDDNSKELFTSYGAQALKARVATYFGDWDDVKSACGVIIGSGNYDIIPGDDYAASWFVDGAANSILELAFSSTDNANINGLQQIYRGGAYGDVEGLADLYNAFDVGDVRAAPDMIGVDPDVATRLYTNLGKYPSYDYSDNIPIFRYEEVVLNYAEALLKTGDAGNALTQLNLITAERNAVAHTVADENTVLLERRRELCFEGLRFHDLARTGRDIPLVDAFLQIHGGPAWGSYNFAFPIPVGEMDANASMVQNTGY
ncbi:MAG: RagB/SusD family nutrient uptake outer membrane protein [Prolixibacteraceae bacterium]|jgi:starch-binding outer membrane protein, SusD/RagB family|nr:RagB/SusD family nutrient uptake outer membrane protein [Prolixibacteraceae bacterium]MBT6764531.1 RagB/SusD family nutrient uptake outer membrane protein [Prolixibacteraceae bacterium]MBT7000050.1 RagB/SusD family nutrient uptake outer membrane protein [Prolixibacteraceae bacterium]MBT7396734.1 RagB/SusD family nutrient uptake outer membrane protein [Prolixibacteraceae bacterium]